MKLSTLAFLVVATMSFGTIVHAQEIGKDKPKPKPTSPPPNNQGEKNKPDKPKPENPKPKPAEVGKGGGNSGGNQGSGGSSSGGFQGGEKSGGPTRPKPGEPVQDQLGRIDRPASKPDRDTDFGKSNRSKVVYGSVNNQSRDNRNSRSLETIERAPIDIFSGSMRNQVLREENPVARYPNQNWRDGYHFYNSGWCDDDFWYSGYVFRPNWRDPIVCSPWYYYHHLPAYLSIGSITIRTYVPTQWLGRPYDYRQSGNWGWNDRDTIRDTLDDLVDSFERRDRRALGRLVPSRGRIDIFVENRYSYSMSADQFYDLMMDASQNTRTRRYEILSVETYRDEVEVLARHEYYDSWGRRNSVYHWYRLEEDRHGYVITKFGTSYRR